MLFLYVARESICGRGAITKWMSDSLDGILKIVIRRISGRGVLSFIKYNTSRSLFLKHAKRGICKTMQNKGSADGVPVPTPKVVAADSVQAEEVPTIPLGSLQTINTLQPEVSVHSAAATQAVMVPVPLVVQPAEYRRSLVEWLKVWWDGIRPAYFALSLLPVVVGTVLAWTQSISSQTPLGHFHPLRFIATIATVALLQVGANLVNDYYDYLRGIDTSNPLGPGGLIQQGLIRPTRVLYAGLTALLHAAAIDEGPVSLAIQLRGALYLRRVLA